MKEFFNKYQTMIFRVGGSIILVIAFVSYFWTTPKEGLSQNKIAAANVARMEARVASGSKIKKTQPSSAEIMQAYKDTQAAQQKYALIVLMIIGLGSLGYSFVKKK